MTTQMYGAVDKVSKSGDTMTGTLTLNGSPAAQASAGAASGGLVTVTNTASAPSNATTQLIAAAAGDKLLGLKVSGDTVARLVGDSNGKLSWGPGGTTAADTTLYRSAAGTLKTDTALTVGTTLTAANGVINAASGTGVAVTATSGTGVAVTGSTAGQSLVSATGADSTSNALAAGVTGDAYDRVRLQVNGTLNIGPGTATRDTTVGRAAAGLLYTPKNLLVGGSTALGDNGVGELQLADVAAVPTTNPTGGSVVYSQSSAGTPLKLRDASGNVRGMVSNTAFATASQSITSTTTQTASTYLTVAVEANATYIVDATLFYTGPASNSILLAFTAPSGVTMTWGTGGSNQAASTTPGATASWGTNGSTTWVKVGGSLITAATTGSLTLTFAQGTSSTTATTLLAGSLLRLERIK